MRVISGKYRGKKIDTLPGINTRPMTDRTKEDLFNILDNYFIFENKIGLDIFAGSGQLGLEGLSRGLKFCYFNDASFEANKIIQKNLDFLKNEQKFLIWQLDYQQVLLLLAENIKLDILFLDPPFKELEYYYKIISYILEKKILNNYGIIICESKVKLDFEQYNLVLLKHKEYSNKHLYILRREDEK